MSTPGIPKGQIGSYSAIKKTSAQKTNTPKQAATGGLNSAQQKIKIYTRGIGQSGTLSGYRSAQRSTNIYNPREAATRYNQSIRSQNQFSGINMRHMANNYEAGGMVYSSGDTSMDIMSGMILGAQAGKTVFGLLNQAGVLGKKSADSTPQANQNTGGGGMSALSKGAGDGISSATLSAMSNAQDSGALSTAIKAANEEVNGLDPQINTAKDELEKLKGDTDNLKKASDEATDVYNNHLGQLQKANETKTQAQNKVSSCQQKYDSAQAAFTTAETALTTAETAFTTAKATYDSLPATIPGSNGTQIENPAKEQAKIAMDKAEAEMNKAKAEKNKAEAEKNKANEALQNAKSELQTAETKVNDLESETQKYKEKADQAKEEYTTNLDNIKTKQDEIKGFEDKKSQLEKEIKTQEKNLEKMKNNEKKEYNQVSNEIIKLRKQSADLMKNINATDDNGLSKKEANNKDKAAAIDARVAQLETRQAELKILVDNQQKI